ncbi:MAG: phosphotransferase [Actinomycetota bacterium]
MPPSSDDAVAEEPLDGGLTNAGAVVRDGSDVLRPAGAQTDSIHRMLRAVRARGFDGVPQPIGLDPDGRQRLRFIEGDVAVVPYPEWSQSDSALASIARLLRTFHDAVAEVDPAGLSFRDALADPLGGDTICHNDVELSNVVFRDGVAVALIDFEFAALGRPVYDLAQLARLCVPIEHEVDQQRMGWLPADRPARLRVIADAYGLDGAGRAAFLGAVDDALGQVEAAAGRRFGIGDERADALIAQTGGVEKYDRRRRWWSRHREAFAAALA